MNVKGPVTVKIFLELLFVAIVLVLFMFVQTAVLAVMWHSAGAELAFVDDGPMAGPQTFLECLQLPRRARRRPDVYFVG